MTETVPAVRRSTRTVATADARPRRTGGRGVSRSRSARVHGFVFTLPALVLLALFVVAPLSQGIYYSFTNWDGAVATWVGFDNFVSLARNPDLRRTLLNSVYILVSIPVGMVLPFATAYLLSSGIRGARLLRIVIFAPTSLSWVVIGLVARGFFASDGPVNGILNSVGLQQLANNWLASPTSALIAVLITFNAAVFGVNTVIFLAGFATVDRSMIEAARVDGASSLRILVSIVLPVMRRFVEFVFVITVVVSFTGLFALIFVMTGGGPGSATTTLEFAVWQSAFSSGDFGLAAALGLVLLLLTVGVIGLVRLVSRGRDES